MTIVTTAYAVDPSVTRRQKIESRIASRAAIAKARADAYNALDDLDAATTHNDALAAQDAIDDLNAALDAARAAIARAQGAAP